MEKNEIRINECPAFDFGDCYVLLRIKHIPGPAKCVNFSGEYTILQKEHRFHMVCSESFSSDIKENFPDIHKRLYNSFHKNLEKKAVVKLAMEMPLRVMENHKKTIEDIVESEPNEKLSIIGSKLFMLIRKYRP